MKKYRTETISKKKAIFYLLVCLFIGSIFIFGISEQQSDINIEEAVAEKAVFVESELIYGIHFRPGSIHHPKPIRLYFEDGKVYEIDASCSSDELAKRLYSLPSGTEVSMLLHPNSDYILDLRTEDEVFLEFEQSMQDFSYERTGFKILGIILYAFAAVIVLMLVFDPKSFI